MVTRWESFYLQIMTLPIMGHVILLPAILDVAGRDGWISILISLPLGLLFGYVIYRFRIRHQEQGFRHITVHLFGKAAGYVILMFLTLYFVFLGVLSAANLADMVHIGFMPETPIWAIVTWFIVGCWYVLNKGLKTVAFMAGILTVASASIGYFVSTISVPLKDFRNMLPVLEFGWYSPLVGTLIVMSVWMELLFLMVIPIEKSGMEKMLRIWNIGIVWNALMMLFPITGVIMIFGLGQVSNSAYPALETVRYISLGFLDRFDLYAMLLMGFGCYIRCGLYLSLGYELAVPKTILQGRSRKVGIVVLCLIVLAMSLYLASDHQRLQNYTIVYTYCAMLYPLPFVYLFLSHWKRMRNKKIPRRFSTRRAT